MASAARLERGAGVQIMSPDWYSQNPPRRLSSRHQPPCRWHCCFSSSGVYGGGIVALPHPSRNASDNARTILVIEPRPFPSYRVVRYGHSASAPDSATRRPMASAQWLSDPNSARQDQSRRVTKCSECS